MKPGDLAIVIDSPFHNDLLALSLVGTVVELVEFLGAYNDGRFKIMGDDGWHVRSGDKSFVASEAVLKPLYDGNEKIEWSQCLWQPRELMRVDSVNMDA